MKKMVMFFVVMMMLVMPAFVLAAPVPDTGQEECYDDQGNKITNCPSICAEIKDANDDVMGCERTFTVEGKNKFYAEYDEILDNNLTLVYYFGDRRCIDANGDETSCQALQCYDKKTAGANKISCPAICYDKVKSGTQITCPDTDIFIPGGDLSQIDGMRGKNNEDCYGQDSNYEINAPAYVLNEKIINDGWSGLSWAQKELKDDEPSPFNHNDSDNTYVWADTVKLIDQLNEVEHGGFSNWRLPTPHEVGLILDFGVAIPPIDSSFFSDMQSGHYWTDTSGRGAESGTHAYYVNLGLCYKLTQLALDGIEADEKEGLDPVDDAEDIVAINAMIDKLDTLKDQEYTSEVDFTTTLAETLTPDEVSAYEGTIKGNAQFGGGVIDRAEKTAEKYVIAVRGNKVSSSGRFEKVDNAVTDTVTGLMWLDSEKEMDWEFALMWSENLSDGGYDDWRLPTIKELHSIIDYSKSGDYAMDTDYFSSTGSEYWTSTNDFNAHADAWYVNFADGNAKTMNKWEKCSVRAVRGGQNKVTGSIFITVPDQTSTWSEGRVMPITWDNSGYTKDVKISISSEGGSTGTFKTIVEATPAADRSYIWWKIGDGIDDFSLSDNYALKIEPVLATDIAKGSIQSTFSIKRGTGVPATLADIICGLQILTGGTCGGK